MLTSPQFTLGTKTRWSYEKKRILEALGEWEDLPMDIKINLQFYAYFAGKTFDKEN